MTLFHNIWSAPETKISEILKYVLMMSKTNSLTWANHIRILCSIYSLPDPLTLMNTPAYPKQKWKELVKTNVTVHAEKKWRKESLKNSKMKYLNVNLLGLNGRQHPVLLNITTTRDIPKLRIYLKF